MDTDKTKDVTVPAQTATLPNAWRIAAPRSSKFELQVRDEEFAFGGIKPSDAMLLMDETGDFAWGVRRVFLVRRVPEGSIVYFDRQCDFDEQSVEFVGEGDKRALRQIDLDVVNGVLQRVHPPHPADEEIPDDEECIGWDFSTVCEMVPAENDENRVYVRKLLETIVTDDLAWLAQFKGVSLDDDQRNILVFLREVGAVDNRVYRQAAGCDTFVTFRRAACKQSRKMRKKQWLSTLTSKDTANSSTHS